MRPAPGARHRYRHAAALAALVVAVALLAPGAPATAQQPPATQPPPATAQPAQQPPAAQHPPPATQQPAAAQQPPPATQQPAQQTPASAQQAPAQPPATTAAGAVLWDPGDERVLYGRAETVGRPMASTTKIMTVLLALEAGTLDDEVVVSPTAAAADDVSGAATLGLRAGQRVPMGGLLAGLMLRSGNDAAVAVAEHVAGSERAFVEKMNARGAELGLRDTTFLDASGLTDDPRHRASPADLALLGATAMRNPVFANWAGAVRLAVPPFGVLENRNELLVRYTGATGVKTGFTRLAGLCLVASATRDGRTLYAVVLGSTPDARLSQHFLDAAALLEHGFTAFRRPTPAAPGTPATVFRWADTAVPLEPAEPLARTVTLGETVTWRTVLPPVLPRPLPAGAPAGHAELLVDGEVAARVELRTLSSVGAPPAALPAPAAAGAAVQEAVRAFVRLQSFERAL